MLKADGGYLVMTARSAGDVMSTVVNNTGTMEAKTLRQNEKGEILLDGGDNGVVELSGTIDASGMEAGQSAGSIKAIGAETHVKDGAKLHATGAVDGGLIETSGDYLEIGDNVDIDAAGKTGKAGEWLLDPTEVIIYDSGTGTVNGGSNAYTSGTTYLKTSTIANILKNNNVKIQATDSTYHNADITLASALDVYETTAGKNTLILEADENININKDINAKAALNVVLNADTNSDDKGGVNINADIRTGGGSLTTGANGATFFGGTDSGENKRVIETSGGNVNIQNEARLQLNGGTLSINSAGGNVNFARNVASMNKYEAFMDHDFVAGLKTDQATAWENMLKSVYGKDYINSNGQSELFIIGGQKDYEKLSHEDKITASNMLARIWELANFAATKENSASDPDGENLNGQHLVTITDKYENSAAMANAVKKTGNVVEYFTGGKDVTERTGEAAKRTDGRTFAWGTGPEAGIAFYETTGEGSGYELNGNYTNWVRNEPRYPRPGYYNEPNNLRGGKHQPYVAIGWTAQNGWDDVENGAGTVHGFIRETELPNSALAINSGAGNVTVGTEGVADTGRLGSGEGTGLRNLSIETTTGNVKVLGFIYVHDNNANAAENSANGNVKIATQGNVDVGQITADKKVEIATTGADKYVTVNGKIATDGLVSIAATDDITVHGIENGDKIRLISTNPNGDGAITLANNAEGGGALITTSDANNAVIIDARGADGSFHNATDATKAKNAITTGTGGNWKVYSASPDRDDFGTNLDSKTTARWHANSQGGNGLEAYAETEDTNKYIFQVQPNLTVTAKDKEKTYGVELSGSDLTVTKTATFKGQNGEDIDVHNYSQAFQEGDVMNHYTGTINVESAGAAAAATRTGGVRTADDNNKAIYDITVSGNLEGKDGYGAPEYVNGNLKINRCTVNLNGSAAQTYGNATLNNQNVYAEAGSGDTGLYGNDKLDTGSVDYPISTTGKYAKSKGNRDTADVGTYTDELGFSNVHVVNGTTNMDANYTFTGNGDITVKPLDVQKDLTEYFTNATYTTKYGERAGFGNATFKDVNGNGKKTLKIINSSALTGNLTGRLTNPVGNNYNTVVSLEGFTAQDLRNYGLDGLTQLTFNDSASVTKADLAVQVGDVWTTYGTPFDEDAYDYSVTKPANDDNAGDLKAAIGDLEYTNKGIGENGKATQNVGHYDLLGATDSVLNNYNIHVEKGDAEVKPLDVQKDLTEYFTNATYTTKYGERAEFGDATFKDVNGNGEKTLHIINSSALTGNLTGRLTNSVGDNYNTVVSLDGFTPQDLINYGLTGLKELTIDNSASVTKADLTIKVGDVWTTYGTPFDEDAYDYSVTKPANDDNAGDLKAAIGDLEYTNKGIGENGKATKDVGHYDLLGATEAVLNNYNINVEKGDAEVKPYTIKREDLVDLDGSPLYTTKYGQKDPFVKATFTGVNGDGTLLLDITDSSALTGAADGRITENVGDNIYDTTVSLESLKNKNYQFADGATSKTFDNTASVTPADLTIETKDVETEYGTVKTTTSEVKGLVNGDLPTGFLFDYGDYGGAYLDGNTKTNDVNTYHFGTDLSGADFLNNYTITGGEADVKIDPKDVTFFVSGTGNTLADVTYTVDPDIDAQLAYGEHVDADYTPGNDLGSNQYGVVAHINGTPIVTGDVAGNYRYNYGGLITLSPTVPTKPDIDPHNPSNLDGSGSWTSNMGNHGVPGVERVAGLASAELPFFKVEAGQVSHYGTYDVAADPDKVRLEPTGKRLPEPNQPKTQYREYTKALTTTDGTGMFRMVYDGSVFRITPTDDAALALVRTGDVKNNVELSAEALHAGFSEMGILLEDLDGVYVHFENLH